MNTIQEGTIVTHLHILGPQKVRVISISRAFNLAVIQFRDLDKTPTEQNTYTVILSTLRSE